MNDKNQTPDPNNPPDLTPAEEELAREALMHTLSPGSVPGDPGEEEKARQIVEEDQADEADRKDSADRGYPIGEDEKPLGE